jgi:PTS system fructose-specific IIC component/PTS system nitrogen regulatory IIA component
MILQDLFHPEYIKVDLDSEEKDDAFIELVNFFCHTDDNENPEDILNAIRMREMKMSTGIQKGVAVPHGKTAAVKKMKGVLGISRKGVQYDALDGEPVYLLFLVISPMDDSNHYLHLLKHLAAMVEIPEFQFELQAQKTPEEAYDVIKKFENVIFG